MAKYKFTAKQRFALWKAWDQKCALCGEPIQLWENLTIDHIISEDLLEKQDELQKILVDYELSPDFNLNSYDNWIPANVYCNRHKSNKLFPKSACLYFINLAKEKVKKVQDLEEKFDQNIHDSEIIAKFQYLVERKGSDVVKEVMPNVTDESGAISLKEKMEGDKINTEIQMAFSDVAILFNRIASTPVDEILPGLVEDYVNRTPYRIFTPRLLKKGPEHIILEVLDGKLRVELNKAIKDVFLVTKLLLNGLSLDFEKPNDLAKILSFLQEYAKKQYGYYPEIPIDLPIFMIEVKELMRETPSGERQRDGFSVTFINNSPDHLSFEKIFLQIAPRDSFHLEDLFSGGIPSKQSLTENIFEEDILSHLDRALIGRKVELCLEFFLPSGRELLSEKFFIGSSKDNPEELKILTKGEEKLNSQVRGSEAKGETKDLEIQVILIDMDSISRGKDMIPSWEITGKGTELTIAPQYIKEINAPVINRNRKFVQIGKDFVLLGFRIINNGNKVAKNLNYDIIVPIACKIKGWEFLREVLEPILERGCGTLDILRRSRQIVLHGHCPKLSNQYMISTQKALVRFPDNNKDYEFIVKISQDNVEPQTHICKILMKPQYVDAVDSISCNKMDLKLVMQDQKIKRVSTI